MGPDPRVMGEVTEPVSTAWAVRSAARGPRMADPLQRVRSVAPREPARA